MRRGIQQTNIRNVWFIPHQYASGTGNYSLKVLHRLCLTGSKIGQTLFRDECEIQTPTFMFRSCPWLEEFWTGVPKGILTLAISGVVSEDLGAVLAFSTLLAQQLILLKFKKKKKNTPPSHKHWRGKRDGTPQTQTTLNQKVYKLWRPFLLYFKIGQIQH